MPYNKNELLTLPLEERKELASDLIDSILADETKPVPDWKKELIQERIKYHNENPGNGIEWKELKKRFGRSVAGK
jgi:putative addiction module component (TIGR02574 family)